MRNALNDAWKQTNPVAGESKKAEHGGNIVNGKDGKPKAVTCPAGTPGTHTMNIPPIKGALGTYHAHPDDVAAPNDPDKEEHKRRIGIFDDSEYRSPSEPPKDITSAKTRGQLGIVVDRFYTYVYQGYGGVWVLPHPGAKNVDPTEIIFVSRIVDLKSYEILRDDLKELPVKPAAPKECQ